MLLGELCDQVLCEQWQVFSLVQCGKMNAEDVETVEQIAAEFAFGNGLLWRTIGGGEQAHVDVDLFAAAETSYGALFDHS